MAISNTEITAKVRSFLTRRWIDVQRLRIVTARGVVHLSGDLCRLGATAWTKGDVAILEKLEIDLKGLSGVKRIVFALTNWRRSDTGRWGLKEKKKRTFPPAKKNDPAAAPGGNTAATGSDDAGTPPPDAGS